MRGDAGEDALFGDRGDDQISGGGQADFIDAGHGDDIAHGSDGHDVITGREGADSLFGGTGRDLLIGGEGEDDLSGGTEQDVLIGGRTVYDGDDGALSEIGRIISGTDYDARIAHLHESTSEFNLRVGETVLDDGMSDRLSGAADRDWFSADRDLGP